MFDVPPERLDTAPLLEAALRGLEGLRGSDDPGGRRRPHRSDRDDPRRRRDAVAVPRAAPVAACPPARRWLAAHAGGGMGRPGDARRRRSRRCKRRSSWYDNASAAEGRLPTCAAGCRGSWCRFCRWGSSDPDWLGGLDDRLAASADDEFLARLPALRGGFLSIACRPIASACSPTVSPSSNRTAREPTPGASPIPRRWLPRASPTARPRAAIARLLPDFALRPVGKTDGAQRPVRVSEPPGEISLADRWRLILGVKGCSSRACRAATALDQLYGASERAGRGERRDLSGRGGTEGANPSAREWVDDIGGLFGKDVCEEVLGEAAASGRAAVLEHLNPETVRPSIVLLEQVLALRGGLPETQMSQLRRLARRITERLAEQLANRLRPALSGLSTPRPTPPANAASTSAAPWTPTSTRPIAATTAASPWRPGGFTFARRPAGRWTGT